MTKILELPQLQAVFNYEIPKNQVVLVSGGQAPSKSWLKEIIKNRPLWCADHGVDICKEAGCVPCQLVGDGDSASSR